ncbi:hypothetical protein ACS0TY_014599 [Phlomoides rotata]
MAEEVSLHANVTRDVLQQTNTLIMGAKRASSHYQQEAEKCTVGVETCKRKSRGIVDRRAPTYSSMDVSR